MSGAAVTLGCNTRWFSLKRESLAARPEYYRAALSALRTYAGGGDAIDSAMLDMGYIDRFVSWLLMRGKSQHTVSSYVRAIRAIYNDDVKAGILPPSAAFGNVPEAVKTPRTILSAERLRMLASHDFGPLASFARVRDLFMFSFYAGGLSLQEMAALTGDDREIMSLRIGDRKAVWVPAMEEIAIRSRRPASGLLLPHAAVMSSGSYAEALDRVGRLLGFPMPLSTVSVADTREAIAMQMRLDTSRREATAIRIAEAVTGSRQRWYGLVTGRNVTREEIGDTLAGHDVVTFIPKLTLMHRTPEGLKKSDDPALRRIMFLRSSAARIDSVQRLLGDSATVCFHMDGTVKRYSTVADWEMHMFRLAIAAGATDIEDPEPVRSAPLRKEQRVVVVGHPLFDGLEGVVAADPAADSLTVKVNLPFFRHRLITPSLHRDYLRLIS